MGLTNLCRCTGYEEIENAVKSILTNSINGIKKNKDNRNNAYRQTSPVLV